MLDNPTTSEEAGQVETPVATSDSQEVTQVQETPVHSTESSQEQSFMIPDKFRGKDLKDVVNSYVNVESQWKKTQSENQELKERAERAEQQAALLAQQQRQPAKVEQPVHSTTLSEEEAFRQDWEKDPEKATLNRTLRAERKIENHIKSLETQNYYNSVKTTLPDFVELEPIMMDLAEKAYASGLVNPDKLNSPEMINTLYYTARGMAVDRKIAQAREAGAAEAKKLTQEKSSAFSEGSSAPGQMTRFEDLSLEEMKALLPHVDRS